MITPSPADPQPDGFPRELLAAYVDGELDAAGRAAVERWLADHPEASAEVEAQRELSPANVPLWERAEPPEPSLLAWANVRRGIEEELTTPGSIPMRPGRWRVAAWTVGGLLTAGVAAAVAWVAFTPIVPPPIPEQPVEVARAPANAGPEIAPLPRDVTSPPPELVAGFAVLPMASDDDVILERVPETHTGWLPVGEPPFSGLLVLASEEEVHLEEVDPSPAWPTGGPKMTTAPGDAPMIFAAKPR
jgi:hypothetical protein